MRGICVVVFGFALTLGTYSSAQTTVTVTAERTNLREKPTTDSTIVQPLQKGAVLDVLETSGTWYRVRVKTDNIEGFVNRLMVGGAPSAPTPPTAGTSQVVAVASVARPNAAMSGVGANTPAPTRASEVMAAPSTAANDTKAVAIAAGNAAPQKTADVIVAAPSTRSAPGNAIASTASRPTAIFPVTGATLAPGTPQVFTYRPPSGASRAVKPKDLNPKDIVDLSIAVDQALPDARLLPGTSLRISVIARDKKGATYSTADGTLATKNLRIVPKLMSYDPANATVTAESDPAKIGKELFAIHAEYGQPNKNPKVSLLALRPDLAAVLGPEPDDVRSLTMQVLDATGPQMLLPGRRAAVRIVATDREGRSYSTDPGGLPLPLSRLDFGGELVQWDRASATFTPSLDRSAIESKKFIVRVGYRGRTDVKAEHEFSPDFAALDGPAPDDIQTLAVTLDGGKDNKLIPGTRTKFNVAVTDKTGRRYELQGGKLSLPPGRLKIAADNFTVDPATGAIEASDDAKKMLNKQYTLTVSYEARDDLSRTLSYEPDFEGLLQSFYFRGDELVVAGDPGGSGEDGIDGDFGRQGNSSSQKYGQGGDGGPGTAGRAGRPGRRGGRGPNIKIVATEVTTLDGATRLVAFELTVPGRETQIFLRPLDAPPLRIISAGGTGGQGGKGGTGGAGGQGGGGYSTGNGGDGASGGDGGQGGPGGPGGNITLITSSGELNASFELISSGGRGGPGGNAGRGGAAGKAGSMVAAVIGSIGNILGAFAGNTETPPPQELGSLGESGQDGAGGDAGMDGEPGQIRKESGGEALALPRKITSFRLGAVVNVPEKIEQH